MNSNILVIVGMPGSGKSTACTFLENQNIPFLHFGEITTNALSEKGLPETPENEQLIREGLRKEYGMGIYAAKSLSKITKMLKESKIIGVDGLYSWEEYLILCKEFPNSVVIMHVFTNRSLRYKRLSDRPKRSLTPDKAFARDVSEIEKLHKSGPIAMADYIVNNNGSIEQFNLQLVELLKKLSSLITYD